LFEYTPHGAGTAAAASVSAPTPEKPRGFPWAAYIQTLLGRGGAASPAPHRRLWAERRMRQQVKKKNGIAVIFP